MYSLLSNNQISELTHQSVKEIINEVKTWDKPHGDKVKVEVLRNFFQNDAQKYNSLAAVEQALHALYKRNGIETTTTGIKMVINNYKKKFDLSRQSSSEIKEEVLTGLQQQKREEIVRAMKKDYKKFKSKYGDEVKAMMYTTASKLVKDLD